MRRTPVESTSRAATVSVALTLKRGAVAVVVASCQHTSFISPHESTQAAKALCTPSLTW